MTQKYPPRNVLNFTIKICSFKNYFRTLAFAVITGVCTAPKEQIYCRSIHLHWHWMQIDTLSEKKLC